MKQKLQPCKFCGKVDCIKVGETTIGCTRCKVYSVSTSFEYIAFTWNYQHGM